MQAQHAQYSTILGKIWGSQQRILQSRCLFFWWDHQPSLNVGRVSCGTWMQKMCVFSEQEVIVVPLHNRTQIPQIPQILPHSRYSLPRDHNRAKAPNMSSLWPQQVRISTAPGSYFANFQRFQSRPTWSDPASVWKCLGILAANRVTSEMEWHGILSALQWSSMIFNDVQWSSMIFNAVPLQSFQHPL